MNTSTYPPPMLRPGDRIRHRLHRGLTGQIKGYEYAERGKLSPIPYCIQWDDSELACDLLGWFFVYACDGTVEAES